MDIKKNLITHYLQIKEQSRIPLFQRKYTWEPKHCKQLIDDIYSVGNSSRPTHFIGTIIYEKSKNESGVTVNYIIDGQQRLTTISLLLCALEDYTLEYYSNKKGKGNEKEDLIKQIKGYQYNDVRNNDLILKLRLNGSSCLPYQELLTNREEGIKNKDVVVDNYYVLLDYFKEKKLKPKTIIKGIEKLLIIEIEVKKQDDVYLVFETVNDRGKQLSDPDKIKNYILMTTSPGNQDNLYQQYWAPMETKLIRDNKEKNFNKFFRYYLNSVLQKSLPKNDYYSDFKFYIENMVSGKNIETVIKDEIYEYFCCYERWLNSKKSDKNKLDVSLSYLKQTKQDIIVPTVLYCLFNLKQKEKAISVEKDSKEKKRLQKEFNKNEKETIKIIDLLSSYFTRWRLCEKESKNLEDVWLTMLKSLSSSLSYQSLFDCIKSLKGTKKEMPSDSELKTILLTSKLYNGQERTWCRYILDRIENYENKDYVFNNEWTIEHIMPQDIKTMSELDALDSNQRNKYDWISVLGNNYELIHNKYLHTLGNLALSGYNPDYQNFTFKVKRDMGSNPGEEEKGYKFSTIKTTKPLGAYSTWDEKHIKIRFNSLFEIVVKIWKEVK